MLVQVFLQSQHSTQQHRHLKPSYRHPDLYCPDLVLFVKVVGFCTAFFLGNIDPLDRPCYLQPSTQRAYIHSTIRWLHTRSFTAIDAEV